MMVHAWENTFVVTKIVDNNNQQEHFLDPLAWVNSFLLFINDTIFNMRLQEEYLELRSLESY